MASQGPGASDSGTTSRTPPLDPAPAKPPKPTSKPPFKTRAPPPKTPLLCMPTGTTPGYSSGCGSGELSGVCMTTRLPPPCGTPALDAARSSCAAGEVGAPPLGVRERGGGALPAGTHCGMSSPTPLLPPLPSPPPGLPLMPHTCESGLPYAGPGCR
eukprot:211175-Chlamydomonas_euryale.AAC.1